MSDGLPETQEEYEDVIYEELDKASSAMSNVACLLHEIKEKEWGQSIIDTIGFSVATGESATESAYEDFKEVHYSEDV